MNLVVMIQNIAHQTQKGESFVLTLKKKQLTPQHNYWLYFIVSKHKTWGERGFYVFVTKQAFPMESTADHLASTLAIDEAKSRLESATQSGMPLLMPTLREGWGLM